MTFTTRFAPSPTGPLHLGHAYSALLAHDMAQASGGRFLLRIDDLDQSRARAEWEEQIYEDLTWLGITWDAPPTRQSDSFDLYAQTIAKLGAAGALFPCRCSRKDIRQAASAPQEGAEQFGPDGLTYPGTCRARLWSERHSTDAYRYNTKSNQIPQTHLSFEETGPAHKGTQTIPLPDLIAKMGDPVIARANMAAAYNFAVVLDDLNADVTHIIRGEDLFEATFVQVYFQLALGLPPNQFQYHHHPLIRDAHGKRLAKRDDARALAKYRAEGATPQDIRQMVGL